MSLIRAAAPTMACLGITALTVAICAVLRSGRPR